MSLPVLLSVPHAGLDVPDRLQANCRLSPRQIAADGDEFAREIYGPLRGQVNAFVTTDIARAVLDMNRAEQDRGKDGVVKTHTCWDEPVWREPLDEATVEWLLAAYHRPYHGQLSESAQRSDLVLAVDCHTMAASGPPVGPDPGRERPQVCLGNVRHQSCPREWMAILLSAFQAQFPGEVAVNQPFSGGHITRHHAREMPWIQLELSRGDFASPQQKTTWVGAAITEAVDRLLQPGIH